MVTTVAVVLRREPLQFTDKHFKLIQPGMRQSEVETILGCPPGDYTTAPTTSAGFQFHSRRWPPERLIIVVGQRAPNSGKPVTWASDFASITVNFDQHGKAVACIYQPLSVLDRTAFQKVWWRIERWWHRSFP
jgi:hypothetical protein